MRIMVVDDTIIMRMHISKVLNDAGHHSILAINGKDCLEQLEKDNAAIDIIFIDWNMPQMNGVETLKAIRSNPKYASIKCIIMTTENKNEIIVEALDHGADEYLLKPLTKSSILDKVNHLAEDMN